MSRATELELRRAIRTRDAFLSTVAQKLDARVKAVSAAARARDREARLAELRGFAAELCIIASPRRPVPLELRRFDLAAFLAGMFEPARCAEHGVVVETTRSGSAFGAWDERHLESIVLELTGNAMKYGKSKPTTLHLEAKGRFVRVVVRNEGTWRGPSGKVELFRREETRAAVRGFGVGLWLSRRLARAHGGKLSFSHRAGQTCATLTLPVDTVRGDLSFFGVSLRKARRR